MWLQKKLRKFEGYYQLNYPCINKLIAGRTMDEWLKLKGIRQKKEEKISKTDKCKVRTDKF